MQFSSLAEVWAMGGYGAFVWSGTGVSMLACLLLVLITRWQRRQLLSRIRSRKQRQERMQAAAQLENTL